MKLLSPKLTQIRAVVNDRCIVETVQHNAQLLRSAGLKFIQTVFLVLEVKLSDLQHLPIKK